MSSINAEVSATEKGVRTVVSIEARWQLYRILALLWVLPSLGAVCILAQSAKSNTSSLLSSVPIENWVALLLLIFQAVFVALMWRCRKRLHAERAARAIGEAD